MDEPRDSHTKWSKSDRERQIPYDITYMWNLKYDINEFPWSRNTCTDIQNRVVVTKGWGWEGGRERDGLGVWG